MVPVVRGLILGASMILYIFFSPTNKSHGSLLDGASSIRIGIIENLR